MLFLTNLSYCQPPREGFTELEPKFIYFCQIKYIYICLSSQTKKKHIISKHSITNSVCTAFEFFQIKAGLAGGCLSNKASHIHKLIY